MDTTLALTRVSRRVPLALVALFVAAGQGCATAPSRAPETGSNEVFTCTSVPAPAVQSSSAPSPPLEHAGPPEVEALHVQLFPLQTCLSPVQVAATLCHEVLSRRGSASVVGRGVAVQDESAALRRAAQFIEAVDTRAFARCPETK